MSTPAQPPLAPPEPAPGAPPPAASAPTARHRPALVIDGLVQVPPGIDDLEAFRRWMRSKEEGPEPAHLAWLAGTLWVDLSPEEAYSHNQVRVELAALRSLAKAEAAGRYVGHGILLSNPRADLSTMPDGQFVSFAAFQGGRVRELPGRYGGVVELEGSPEMVLEVVSDSSVEKDTALLPELYHRAGIQEFWRVDARGELRFEILRRADTGYVPAQGPDGWWRSEVFGRSFRMTRQPDPLGDPLFTLEVRE